MSYRIDGLEQGVPYYVRVAATNAIGYGEALLATPRYEIPLSGTPSKPEEVTLSVVHSDSLRVDFNTPTLDGGNEIDQYLIEWFTSDFVEEEQAIRVFTSVTNEIQIIETHAVTPVNTFEEVQVVRTFGTGDGTSTTEIQVINCDADSGTFRVEFDGSITEPIAFDATASDLEQALESLADVISDVDVTIDGTQTAICAPGAENVNVEFVSVTNFVGAVPQMQTHVSSLGGTRNALVSTSRPGQANVQGYFVLSFNGDETSPIAADATDAQLENALNALDSIGTAGVRVQKTDGSNGQSAWYVTFSADQDHLRGDQDTIVVEDSSSLYGNGARVVICADNDQSTDCSDVSSVTGNEIRGTFTLTMRGHETEPIEYNAADSTVKRRLEELPNVGTVTVNRVQTSPEKTYRWTVTFDSNPGLFPAGT